MFVKPFTRAAGTRTLRRPLAVAAVVTGCQLLAAPGAAAHAGLVGCAPTFGAELADGPDAITLQFSEPLRAEFVEVGLRVDGAPVPGLRPAVDGVFLRVNTAAVARADGPAQWELAYRVVSADAHPVNGSLDFRTGASGGADALAAPISGPCGAPGGGGLGPGLALAGAGLAAIGVALAVVRRRTATS